MAQPSKKVVAAHAGKWVAVIGAIVTAYIEAKGAARLHADRMADTAYQATRYVEKRVETCEHRIERLEDLLWALLPISPNSSEASSIDDVASMATGTDDDDDLLVDRGSATSKDRAEPEPRLPATVQQYRQALK